jgi:hypothetical protein
MIMQFRTWLHYRSPHAMRVYGTDCALHFILATALMQRGEQEHGREQ